MDTLKPICPLCSRPLYEVGGRAPSWVCDTAGCTLREVFLAAADIAALNTRPQEAAQGGVPNWQPMESAPKAARHVLLRDGSLNSVLAHWMDGGYCIEDHPPIDAGWYYWTGRQYDVFRYPVQWCAATAPMAPAQPAKMVEDTAEEFIQAAIDRAPEPLRRLGEWLTHVLNDGHWPTAERLLLGAATQAPAQQCETCGGHGLIGGLTRDNGYDGETCPDCLGAGSVAPAQRVDDEAGSFQARYRLGEGEWSSWGHVVCGVKGHEMQLRYLAPAQQWQPPKGWKLVPLIPTVEMCDAANASIDVIDWTDAAPLYHTMIAAAPPAPAQEGEE